MERQQGLRVYKACIDDTEGGEGGKLRKKNGRKTEFIFTFTFTFHSLFFSFSSSFCLVYNYTLEHHVFLDRPKAIFSYYVNWRTKEGENDKEMT